MNLNSKTYDALKFVALILLPGVATLMVGLGGLYGWDFTEEVVGTITLVDTFLGSMLKLSSSRFNNDVTNFDGFLSADGRDDVTGHPNLKLTVTTDPNDLLVGDVARLKIGPAPEPRA